MIDWDDTIGDFRQAELHALQDIYVNYDLQRVYADFQSFYDIYHPYNLHLWDLYGYGKITKEELEFERFYHPIKVLPDSEQIASQIGKKFLRLTTHYFSLLPQAAESVRTLAAHYPLTVVSNGFVEVQYEKIRRSGLEDCFQHVVLSEEAGVQKPDAAIFEYALRLNGIGKEDALMIGDRWSSDIQGALNAGIDQMWITLTPPDDNHPSTYWVKSLSEAVSRLTVELS